MHGVIQSLLTDLRPVSFGMELVFCSIRSRPTQFLCGLRIADVCFRLLSAVYWYTEKVAAVEVSLRSPVDPLADGPEEGRVPGREVVASEVAVGPDLVGRPLAVRSARAAAWCVRERRGRRKS